MIKIAVIFWVILKSLWFVWLTVFVTAVIPILINILIRKINEARLRRWLEKHKKLEDWKKLDGRKFEKIVALIYKNLGYQTKIIGGAGDRGIDIIIKKDRERTFIQCKQMDIVSPKYVREFYGSVIDHLGEGERGLLVTTGGFTAEGKEFAKDKSIELIDGLKLEKLAK